MKKRKMSLNDEPVAKEFNVVIPDAYPVKVLSEILNSNLGEGNVIFKEEEIILREADANEEIMIDVVLRGSDIGYQPPSKTTIVGITFKHFYQTLRRVKKKDSLQIYREEGSDLLSFNILNVEKARDKSATIRSKEVPESKWTLPEYSKSPVTTIPASEFQRMCKEMTAASKTITIKIQKNGIKFLGGTEPLYSIADKYGVWVENGEEIYSKVFNSKQLSHLSKCSGLAQNVNLKVFCGSGDDPLMFTAPIGSIGSFKVMISPPK